MRQPRPQYCIYATKKIWKFQVEIHLSPQEIIAVTEPTFMKLKLAVKRYVKKLFAEVYKNPINGLIADT